MKPLQILADWLRNLGSACSSLGRALLDWVYDPAPASEQEARGRKLLLEWLSEAQRKEYEERNCFEVTGCHTGKRYRIRYGMGTNVYELDDKGRPLTGWCFVPEGYLVAGDVMLAQKIALETDERAHSRSPTTSALGDLAGRRPAFPASKIQAARAGSCARCGGYERAAFGSARSRSHPNTERPSRSGDAARSAAMKDSSDGPFDGSWAARSSRRA